jgi:hypothetical protein
MKETRKEAFETFVKTEQDYNFRLLCVSDAMEDILKEFMRGEIPVESLIEFMADMANQIREDGEDRKKNLDRFVKGKVSYPMWYGSWKD